MTNVPHTFNVYQYYLCISVIIIYDSWFAYKYNDVWIINLLLVYLGCILTCLLFLKDTYQCQCVRIYITYLHIDLHNWPSYPCIDFHFFFCLNTIITYNFLHSRPRHSHVLFTIPKRKKNDRPCSYDLCIGRGNVYVKIKRRFAYLLDQIIKIKPSVSLCYFVRFLLVCNWIFDALSYRKFKHCMIF